MFNEIITHFKSRKYSTDWFSARKQLKQSNFHTKQCLHSTEPSLKVKCTIFMHRNVVLYKNTIPPYCDDGECMCKIHVLALRLTSPASILLAGPDLAGGRPGASGGRPGPSGLFGISERDWLSNYRVLKIERFGGRPPVGGRPGARAPPAPLNPALTTSMYKKQS